MSAQEEASFGSRGPRACGSAVLTARGFTQSGHASYLVRGWQSDPNPRGAGEGHDVHIESSVLEVEPQAHVRWHRDIYGNSIAVLNFTKPAQNSASLASLSSLITLRIPSTLSLIQMGSSHNLF
jgi:Bacterial transglutaminase-like N-terminal region